MCWVVSICSPHHHHHHPGCTFPFSSLCLEKLTSQKSIRRANLLSGILLGFTNRRHKQEIKGKTTGVCIPQPYSLQGYSRLHLSATFHSSFLHISLSPCFRNCSTFHCSGLGLVPCWFQGSSLSLNNIPLYCSAFINSPLIKHDGNRPFKFLKTSFAWAIYLLLGHD